MIIFLIFVMCAWLLQKLMLALLGMEDAPLPDTARPALSAAAISGFLACLFLLFCWLYAGPVLGLHNAMSPFLALRIAAVWPLVALVLYGLERLARRRLSGFPILDMKGPFPGFFWVFIMATVLCVPAIMWSVRNITAEKVAGSIMSKPPELVSAYGDAGADNDRVRELLILNPGTPEAIRSEIKASASSPLSAYSDKRADLAVRSALFCMCGLAAAIIMLLLIRAESREAASSLPRLAGFNPSLYAMSGAWLMAVVFLYSAFRDIFRYPDGFGFFSLLLAIVLFFLWGLTLFAPALFLPAAVFGFAFSRESVPARKLVFLLLAASGMLAMWAIVSCSISPGEFQYCFSSKKRAAVSVEFLAETIRAAHEGRGVPSGVSPEALAGDPRTPPDMLAQMADRAVSEEEAKKVLANPSLPEEAVVRLAGRMPLSEYSWWPSLVFARPAALCGAKAAILARDESDRIPLSQSLPACSGFLDAGGACSSSANYKAARENCRRIRRMAEHSASVGLNH